MGLDLEAPELLLSPLGSEKPGKEAAHTWYARKPKRGQGGLARGGPTHLGVRLPVEQVQAQQAIPEAPHREPHRHAGPHSAGGGHSLL